MGLPDFQLPRIHADPRQGIKDAVKLECRQLMVDMLGDRVGHALMLAAGPFHWRQIFGRHMGWAYDGNRAGCDYLADVLFRFAERSWRDFYQTETREGFPNPSYDGLSPQQLLDTVEYKSPPTQQEIDNAWEVEIAGDERAMRIHYEGSARVRKGNDLGERKVALSPEQIRKIASGED